MTDDMFGPYRLRELLGHGGMGEVWRARDVRKDRDVAVKVLGSWLGSDTEFVRRFRREAAVAARLNAPNIVPIHDYGQIDDRLFIDMPLIDGIDLAALVARDGPLPPARAVGIIAQAARGLAAAHAAGLIHRDVKPANILVTESGGEDHVYLIDFGISREVDGSRLSISGAVIGTPAYMAPERFAGEGDHRVDVYALGCVLYQALTTIPPYPQTNPLVLMHAHLHAPPPRPTDRRPDVPAALDGVVARGMAKNPDDRYPSTVALAAAARAALAPPPPPAPVPLASSVPGPGERYDVPVDRGSPGRSRGGGRPGRLRELMAAGAVVVLGAALIVGLSLGGLLPGSAGRSVPIAGPMNIWVVDGPAVLPARFSSILQRYDVSPVVTVVPGSALPARFAEAASRSAAPDIIAGSNYTPFESIAGERGETGVLTTVAGPLESLVGYDGFVFLPVAGARHAAAVALATAENSCPPAGAPPRSSPDADMEPVATDAVRALLSGDGTALAGLLAPASIQSTIGLTPHDVHDVSVCHRAGNGTTGLVFLSATYSSASVAGQINLAVVLVRSGTSWKVLLASYDPVLLNLAATGPSSSPLDDRRQTGTLLRAVDGLAASPSPAGNVTVGLVGPVDGEPPPVPDGQLYGDFAWSTTGDTNLVVAEFGEFAFEGTVTPRLVPAARSGGTSRVSEGELWTSRGNVLPWRAWVLLADGRIVTSATRHFTQ